MTATTTKPRILEFDYFRGVAIILIVLGHSTLFGASTLPPEITNFFSGNTALFVFISGFFLHAVFYPNIDYKKFMQKKVYNILYPTFFVSIAIMLFYAAYEVRLNTLELADDPVDRVLLLWKGFLIRGYAAAHLWYIPFIMLAFTLTPLYIKFIGKSWRLQVALIAGFCIISLFIHRPYKLANTFQHLVYYTPFYLMGILYSEHKAWFSRHLTKLTAISSLLCALFLLMQSRIQPTIGIYHKHPFEYDGVDWQFMQKVALLIPLIYLCTKLSYAPRDMFKLKPLANISFGVYFLHYTIISLMLRVVYILAPETILESPVLRTLLSLILSFITIMICSIIVFVIKRLTGKRSRMFIGC